MDFLRHDRAARARFPGGARAVLSLAMGVPMGYKSHMDSPAKRRPERFAIGVILAAALALRVFGLARQSLWVDELLSIKAFEAPEGVSYAAKFFYDVHGPLYSLFMHFWSMIADGDAWLRIPSALAGVISVYLVYRWLVALGRRDLALYAALFMALSPFQLYYSQEIRFYSFLTLFVIVALIAFERFRARPSAGTGALLGLTIGLACLAHLSGLFLGAALVLYALLPGRAGRNHVRFGLLAAAIALLVVSPWIYREITFLRGIRVVDVSSMPVAERLRGELTLSRWSYPYALYAFSAGYSLGPSLRELHSAVPAWSHVTGHAAAFAAVGAVFGALLVSGIVRTLRGGHLGLFLMAIAIAAAAVGLATAFNVKVFNARYLMCVFPFFIALLAFGLPPARSPRIASAAAVCAIMLVSDWNYHFDGRYAREDVKSAAETAVRNELPGDLYLVPCVGFVFERYYRGAGRVVIFPPASNDVAVDEKLQGYFDAHPRLWYLESRVWDHDPEGRYPKLLSRHGFFVRSWDFSGATLMLYERKRP